MAKAFNIEIKMEFKGNAIKSQLNKLQDFLRYSATIGIHGSDGNRNIVRKYIGKDGKGHVSGKSYTMTLIKLAWQNEFGADIPIKPRYVTKSRDIKSTVHTLKQRITNGIRQKYSELASVNKQGYLILDKRGNFVAYFKPGSVIHIPARPFIYKIIQQGGDRLLLQAFEKILKNTFIKGGYRARESFKKMVQLIQFRMKQGVQNNQKRNHPITIKAKGQNSPLIDEQNRLAKYITYKIYKNANIVGSKGNIRFQKQQSIEAISKLKKTIKQFEDQGVISEEKLEEKVFTYKGFNPNFAFRDYYGY